jgi:hypothetical protein
MLHAALTYAEMGVPVFPLSRTGKPLVKWGEYAPASEDLLIDQTVAWWEEHRDAGIGAKLGQASRVWLLDIDVPSDDRPDRPDGEAAFRALIEQHGPLEPGPVSRSKSGGWHYWFATPPVGRVRCSTSELGPGLDVKGDGGMGILPPTRVDGGEYTWVRDPGEFPLRRAPRWLEEMVMREADSPTAPCLPPIPCTGHPYGQAALRNACERVALCGEGSRHKTLNRQAWGIGRLIVPGYVGREDAVAALTQAGLACGLSEKDVDKTVADGIKAGMKNPRVIEGAR